MSKILFFWMTGLLSFSLMSLAQKKEEFGLPPTEVREGSLHEGDLFKVKMIPGDKETSFYVVGRKTGAVKIDKMKMQAVMNVNGVEQRYLLKRRQDAFVLPAKVEKELQLELQGEKPAEHDKLHIKLIP